MEVVFSDWGVLNLLHLASVRMVRNILDRTRAGHPKLHVIERAVSLRGMQEHCRSGFMCYYKVDGVPS